MKFTVERDALADALSAVIGLTKGGLAIPILSHVLVEAGANQIKIVASDLDRSSIVTVPADVDSAGSLALPADRLNQLIGGSAKGSQVIIECGDDEPRATVKCGRANYKFAFLPASDFPAALEAKDGVSFDITPEQAARMFKTPAPSISNAKDRFYLHGICIHPRGKELAACATDGVTLLRTLLPLNFAKMPKVIVPKSSVGNIVDVAKENGATICVSQNVFSVSSGNRSFSTKLIDANFPEYERVIPAASEHAIKVNAVDLDAALGRLVAACDPDLSPVVHLAWEEGDASLSATLSTKFGEGVETIECDLSGRKSGDVAMRLEFLRKLIDAADADVLHLHVNGSMDTVRIENPKDDKLNIVIMPCAA